MKTQKEKSNENFDLKQVLNGRPFLLNLLVNKTSLLECDAQAPSPSKDYGRLEINLNQVKSYN